MQVFVLQSLSCQGCRCGWQICQAVVVSQAGALKGLQAKGVLFGTSVGVQGTLGQQKLSGKEIVEGRLVEVCRLLLT